MTHSFPLRRILAASLAALALASGSAAIAESQYGYATATGATVTATARVNLSIVVPKLILLRVGTTTTGGDTLSWTADFGITPTPTVANNQNYAWTGAAPTTTTGTNPAVLASAWTNSSTGGSLSYVATDFGAGGPTLGNITVGSVTGSGAALNHPLPAALATASTTSTTFAANTLANSNWTFTLAGTPSTWRAGTYTSLVTYTATAL